MLVLHRVGNKLVAEPVFKVEFDQQPDGDTDIRVETEDATVEKGTIITFMTEGEAVARFNEAVDPTVVLDMIADLMPSEAVGDEHLSKIASELESHLGDVMSTIKKFLDK